MSEFIACTPRTLTPESLISAADDAVRVNPQNDPQNRREFANLVEAIPDFNPSREWLAVATAKYWGPQGVRLSVGFVDTTPTDLRKRIISHLNAWNRTANVQFVETDDAGSAEVRINRETHPQAQSKWDGYWSFLGTDILGSEGPMGQTMNLEGFTMSTPDAEFHRVVRHEAGHTLGFPHEHMRTALVERIDRDKAVAYYKARTGWSTAQIVRQVLTPLEEADLMATEDTDDESIMAYQIPAEVTVDGEPIPGGLDISETDYAFCAKLYPKPEA